MITDPVADLLTRIRNALRVHKSQCVLLFSKLSCQVLDVLVREGYILGYEEREVRTGVREIVVALKYFADRPVIDEIARVSKPGRRVYHRIQGLPRVNNGLGVFVLSTSRGVLSDREAREHHIGGEVLCRVC